MEDIGTWEDKDERVTDSTGGIYQSMSEGGESKYACVEVLPAAYGIGKGGSSEVLGAVIMLKLSPSKC